MQPHHSCYWKFKDKEFRFDIYPANTFDDLTNVKQVYALVLNEERSKVLVVYNKWGMWLLPGGGVEEDETLFDTLVREVKEETNRDIDIKTVKPLFYQESYKKDTNGKWQFNRIEVRYTVEVENDLDFEYDPDNGDIVEAKWVEIKDLDKYLDWGETVTMIQDILLENKDSVSERA